jgi:hypothetical protein
MIYPVLWSATWLRFSDVGTPRFIIHIFTVLVSRFAKRWDMIHGWDRSNGNESFVLNSHHLANVLTNCVCHFERNGTFHCSTPFDIITCTVYFLSLYPGTASTTLHTSPTYKHQPRYPPTAFTSSRHQTTYLKTSLMAFHSHLHNTHLHQFSHPILTILAKWQGFVMYQILYGSLLSSCACFPLSARHRWQTSLP